MKNWFAKNYRTLIITAFLVPIITVAVVSISHVGVWYSISNPSKWAFYLSIGIEIAALSALAAISANMGKKVYFPFIVVTIIQFIGNIYFAYGYINPNSKEFKDWVELVHPLLELIGVEPDNYTSHRRFLSLFAGGVLPMISLSFLHMLVKFSEETKSVKETQVLEESVIEDSVVKEEPVVEETNQVLVDEPVVEEEIVSPIIEEPIKKRPTKLDEVDPIVEPTVNEIVEEEKVIEKSPIIEEEKVIEKENNNVEPNEEQSIYLESDDENPLEITYDTDEQENNTQVVDKNYNVYRRNNFTRNVSDSQRRNIRFY